MTSYAQRGTSGEFVGHNEVSIESVYDTIARLRMRREMATSAAVTMVTPANGRTDIQNFQASVCCPSWDDQTHEGTDLESLWGTR